MCTTTHDKTNTGPSGAQKVPPPKAPSPADKQLPYAAVKYPTLATPDSKFQAALDAALAAQITAGRFGPDSHVAISMIALTDNGTHKYADKFDEEMHFSASLVKVAAMYAAHAKRQEVSQEDLLTEMKQTRPLSVVMEEQVRGLREWATERTVPCD